MINLKIIATTKQNKQNPPDIGMPYSNCKIKKEIEKILKKKKKNNRRKKK